MIWAIAAYSLKKRLKSRLVSVAAPTRVTRLSWLFRKARRLHDGGIIQFADGPR